MKVGCGMYHIPWMMALVIALRSRLLIVEGVGSKVLRSEWFCKMTWCELDTRGHARLGRLSGMKNEVREREEIGE